MPKRITALVLCQGAGSRMRPLSLFCSKALLPFCGRPLLEYTIAELRRHQITDVVVVTGLRDDGFKRYESMGRTDRMNMQVVRCGANLGSAGVVKRVVEALGLADDHLLVIYGDSLFRIDLTALLDAHRREQKAGCEVTIAYHSPDNLVSPGESHTNYGILWLGSDRRVTRFVEKPPITDLTSNYANSGIFVLNRKFIDLFPAELPADFSRDIFTAVALGLASPVFGFDVKDGYRFDIGTIREYVRRQFDVLDGLVLLDGVPWERVRSISNPLSRNPADGKALVGLDCQFGQGVMLRGHNVIGNRVRIGDGAELAECVILDETNIGPSARLTDTVLGRACRITENVVLGEGTVLGDFSVVA